MILDVGGVGYVVSARRAPCAALPQAGEAATLAIETYVREDQIRLFGFTTDLEREWFRLLQTVQGVGTKVALAILSTLKAADLASAIALGDKAAIARSPGVGPKVAQRIVTELKDRARASPTSRPASPECRATSASGARRRRRRCRLGAGQSRLWPGPGLRRRRRRACARPARRPRRPGSSASASRSSSK